MAKIFCIILVAMIPCMASQQCYLKSCREKRVHTLCKYTSPKPAAACGKNPSTGLTDEEQQEIVDVHNKMREKVAKGQESQGNPGPQPAGVIPPLEWDDELANIAQRWANQCNFNHDKCRNVERFEVGQNIAETSTSGGTQQRISELVQSWYDEVAKLDLRKVGSYEFDPDTGHYTQVVWGKTTTIGCGAIRYFMSNGWYTTYLVCNYGPSGNWIGQPIYETC